MPTVRFVVHGRVQGVGFRYFVRCAARALRLEGWVRNSADRVEALASGAAWALDRLETKLREGPPSAHVESVSREVVQDDATLPHPFTILR